MTSYSLLIFSFLFVLTCGSAVQCSRLINLEKTINGSRQGSALTNAMEMTILPHDEGSPMTNWAALRVSEGKYHGAEGVLNVWNLPTVGKTQSSVCLIWISNGVEGPNENLIMAGWEVNPSRYGDLSTHFVIYWTADGGQSTGCYNLDCKGFVAFEQSKYKVGTKIMPVSSYDRDQYTLPIKIEKNNRGQGDWWLYSGPNSDEPVGFWPKSLFTRLSDYADHLQWGGAVSYYKNEKSPPMGSGYHPSFGLKRAAFITRVGATTDSGEKIAPEVEEYVNRKDCYDIIGDGNGIFFFGGPGGCTFE